MEILIFMLFMHIVDDYYLQGWLASGKQKAWWRSQQNYSDKYKFDYIAALIMHSFSWTFCIMLPVFYVSDFNADALFYFVFFTNTVIHATTDDLKANRGKINLIQDQTIHILQVIATFCMLV